MKFSIERDAFLALLQTVAGVVDKRHTIPILSNILIIAESDTLRVLANDLDIQLTGHKPLDTIKKAGKTTVAGRKLVDICRSFSAQSMIEFSSENQKITLKSGLGRFQLASLPAEDFPLVEETVIRAEFTLSATELHSLLVHTQFSMAQQDVRYYLNGLLLEVSDKQTRAVATDGHRLAMSTLAGHRIDTLRQMLIPRKGVVELLRLLNATETEVRLCLRERHLEVVGAEFHFVSKLIDGAFPDYHKVIPKEGDKQVILDRDAFREALSRVSILSNEKFRGVWLHLKTGHLVIASNNTEQESAEEELVVDYQGDLLDIGFNAHYLLDALNVMAPGDVRLSLSRADSSALLQEATNNQHLFVIMPMQL